jgi:hypothetical protein
MDFLGAIWASDLGKSLGRSRQRTHERLLVWVFALRNITWHIFMLSGAFLGGVQFATTLHFVASDIFLYGCFQTYMYK